QTRQFAAFLQHDAGLSKGDRVALMMPNMLQYPIALFGTLRAGMVAVNVNPLYTPRELEHQLADAGAKAIVIVENFASTLQKVADRVKLETIITTQIGDRLPGVKRLLTNFVVKRVKKMVPAFSLPGAISFNTALSNGAGRSMQVVELVSGVIALLQYTGSSS